MRILNILCLIIFFLTVHEALFNDSYAHLKEISDNIPNVCANNPTNPTQCPCQCVNNDIYCCQLNSSIPTPSSVCGMLTCSARNVTIINSDLQKTSISAQFSSDWLGIHSNNIEILRFRNCTLGYNTVGPGFDQLKILDIRGNIVKAFKEPDISSLVSIFLSGNDWPCLDPNKEKHEGSKTNLQFGREMSWLLGQNWEQQWSDRENTFCKFAHDEDIVEEEVEVNKHSLISFLQFTEKTSSTCPEFCDCEVADETRKYNLEDMSRFRVNVVCTDQGLTSLPDNLPPDTIFLNVANNQISSLMDLSDMNPGYKDIEKLIVANNSLKSLQGLENSWLQHNGPVLLDVRNNILTQLDTMALEPMLSKASVNLETEGNYYFGDNPWTCNCENIKTLQEFLQKYNSLIKDTEYMQCSDCECSLLHLDYKQICAKDHDYMVWVIIVETSLIVIILLKLSWDCIQYRRTGELPWVAKHLCWSVPGISRSRWAPTFSSICAKKENESGNEVENTEKVTKGSSGYLTYSGSSSNSEKKTSPRVCPGDRESSVVRFL